MYLVDLKVLASFRGCLLDRRKLTKILKRCLLEVNEVMLHLLERNGKGRYVIIDVEVVLGEGKLHRLSLSFGVLDALLTLNKGGVQRSRIISHFTPTYQKICIDTYRFGICLDIIVNWTRKVLSKEIDEFGEAYLIVTIEVYFEEDLIDSFIISNLKHCLASHGECFIGHFTYVFLVLILVVFVDEFEQVRCKVKVYHLELIHYKELKLHRVQLTISLINNVISIDINEVIVVEYLI